MEIPAGGMSKPPQLVPLIVEIDPFRSLGSVILSEILTRQSLLVRQIWEDSSIFATSLLAEGDSLILSFLFIFLWTIGVTLTLFYFWAAAEAAV